MLERKSLKATKKATKQTGTACISSVEISVVDSSGDKIKKNHLEFGKERKLSKRMSMSEQSECAETIETTVRKGTESSLLTNNDGQHCGHDCFCYFVFSETGADYFGVDKLWIFSYRSRQRCFSMFLNSSYILNNILNPFIYSFMNTKFKLELHKLFCRKC